MDPVFKTAARIDGRDSATAVEVALEQAGVTGEEPAHTGTALERDMDAALAALRKRRETDERAMRATPRPSPSAYHRLEDQRG